MYLHRVYDRSEPTKGQRFLVERLWPRGIRKEELRIDGWVKDAAPSAELRKWFSHDPAKWEAFRERYFRELEANPAGWVVLLEAAREGDVTLIFSSRDPDHNNAVAFREFLERKLTSKRTSMAARPARKRAA